AKAKAEHRCKGRAPTARRKADEIIRRKSEGMGASEIASRLAGSRQSKCLSGVGRGQEPTGGCMKSTLTVPRMYTDEAGDCRFDSYEMDLTLHDHAPPAAPFLTTEPEQATKYIFFRIPPGWIGAQHPTPNYRLVICLAGSLRFIGSTGDRGRSVGCSPNNAK